MSNTRKSFAAIMLLFVLITTASAELVTQPAYHHMSFYVYKPANLPGDFYTTFDGYIVYRGAHGVWYYASAEKSGIARTDYVVGSVIPDVVRLKPYNARVSSVAPIYTPDKAAPVYNPDIAAPSPVVPPVPVPAPAPVGVVVPEIVYVPPVEYNVRTVPAYLPNSGWTVNANFTAIGRWHNSIDRVGVLSRPYTPVAWKGDYPEVIYVWTGARWRELFPKGTGRSALSTIRREIYGLTVEANKSNALNWSRDDTNAFAHYAAMWGYRWMGIIDLGRSY